MANLVGREIHKGRLHFEEACVGISDGTIWDYLIDRTDMAFIEDPTSVGCGDDDLWVRSPLRYRLFERFLISLGAEISKGSHFESRVVGVFTESPYPWISKGPSKPRDRRGFGWMDSVKIKTITTPEDRLPGRKEIPVLWNRGSAVGSAVGKMRYTEHQKLQRKNLLSHCYYKWYRFIQQLISLGIPVHLPKELGGFGLPHYKGKDLSKVSLTVRAALRALFRDDQSMEFLRGVRSLGSIWNPHTYSPLSVRVRKIVDGVLWCLQDVGKIFSLRSLLDLGIITEADYPKYPNKGLKELHQKLEGIALPFDKGVDLIEQKIRSYLLWVYPDIPKDPRTLSLRVVSKRLNEVCKEIISGCPEIAYSKAPLSSENLAERYWWRKNILFISLDHEVILKALFVHYLSDEISKELTVDPYKFAMQFLAKGF